MAQMIGLATFLVAFFWASLFLFLPQWLRGFDWYRSLPDDSRLRVVSWTVIGGAIVMLLLWQFVLPDWWKSATPLWTNDR